jgi:hypothetical protein
MGNAYYKWSKSDDIRLFLQLVSPSGLGATGLSPEVAIRRISESQGGVDLDGYYWDGAVFISTPTWLTMTEVDAVNQPGLYFYKWEQSLIQTNIVHDVYYRHLTAPIGFAVEQHVVTDEIQIPASSPIVPVDPNDTVMGKLAQLESPSGPQAEAIADAVWDEELIQHLLPGSTGAALNNCSSAQIGASMVEITIEDQANVPIQGAFVDVFDATNTNFIMRGVTDINGLTTIAIQDGSYNVRVFKSGYAFTVPETLVVSGDGAITYNGTNQLSIIPPGSPDLCAIFGTIVNAAGVPIPGACVQAYAVTPQAVGGNQDSGAVAGTVTDSNGFFQIDLVRNTVVRFFIEEADIDVQRTVPDAVQQDITTWT